MRYAFWFGGAALFLAVLWTVLTTREYSPEQMAEFEGARAEEQGQTVRDARRPKLHVERSSGSPPARWSSLAVRQLGLEKEVYLLGGLLIAYGLASIIAISLRPARQRARACSATSSAISRACPS